MEQALRVVNSIRIAYAVCNIGYPCETDLIKLRMFSKSGHTRVPFPLLPPVLACQPQC
jgi:hypothetical protein